MWHYSLNWMGPISKEFLEQYGYNWCGGRIDCRYSGKPQDDPDYEPYGNELGVATMYGTSWSLLDTWLDGMVTHRLLNEETLFVRFENETGHRIRWWSEEASKHVPCN